MQIINNKKKECPSIDGDCDGEEDRRISQSAPGSRSLRKKSFTSEVRDSEAEGKRRNLKGPRSPAGSR